MRWNHLYFSPLSVTVTLVSHHSVNQLVLQVVELLYAEKDVLFSLYQLHPPSFPFSFMPKEFYNYFFYLFIFISAFSQTRNNQSSCFLTDKYRRDNVTNSLQPTSFCSIMCIGVLKNIRLIWFKIDWFVYIIISGSTFSFMIITYNKNFIIIFKHKVIYNHIYI